MQKFSILFFLSINLIAADEPELDIIERLAEVAIDNNNLREAFIVYSRLCSYDDDDSWSRRKGACVSSLICGLSTLSCLESSNSSTCAAVIYGTTACISGWTAFVLLGDEIKYHKIRTKLIDFLKSKIDHDLLDNILENLKHSKFPKIFTLLDNYPFLRE